MAKNIYINGTPIDKNRAYIIAEAGSNHNGDYETAKKLIVEAAKAGADAIKFQAFKAKYHYSKHTPGFNYLEEGGFTQSTYDLIKSLEINREWHQPLMKFSEECGITFLSSPCDYEAINQFGELDMAAFKLASFDLPDIKLIKEMACFKKPLILSTGMADYADIQSAIRAAEEEGNNQIILLQCTSLYPAPVELSNLAAIGTLEKAFGYPVGYSDHTIGDHIPIAAVALGAVMIEKHFTLDKNQSGPDHNFAMEPEDFRNMVEKIRDVEKAIGNGIKDGPRSEELEMYEKGRRSIHVNRKICAGEKIQANDLVIKRPSLGISPKLLNEIVGMEAKRDIEEDHWISWEDLK